MSWKITLNDELLLLGEELLDWSLSLGCTNDLSLLEARFKKLVFSENDVLKAYINDELALEGIINKFKRRTKDFVAYAPDKLILLNDKKAKGASHEYLNQKAGVIFKDLLNAYLPNVYNVDNIDDGPTVSHVELYNQELSRCVKELCTRSKYDLWLEPPNKIFFKPRASLSSNQIVIYGDEIVALDLDQDYLGEKTLAIVRGRGGLVGTAGEGDKELLFYDEDASTQEEVNELAQAWLDLFSLDETKYEGSMRLKTLNPKLRAGRTIVVRAKERFGLDDASMRIASASLDPLGTSLQIGIVRHWLRRYQRKSLNDGLRQLVDKIIIVQGTLAQRPSPGLLGRLYYTTDEKILYRDTGTSWEEKARGETATRLAELSEKDFTSMEGYLAFTQAEDPFARYSFGKERRILGPIEVTSFDPKNYYFWGTGGSGGGDLAKDLFRVYINADQTDTGKAIEIGRDTLCPKPQMALDPWFKCKAYLQPYSGRRSHVVVGERGWVGGGWIKHFGFELNGTNLDAVTGNGGGNETTTTIATGVSAGWYLLEARSLDNGTKIKFYLNGVYKTEITTTLPTDPLTKVFDIAIYNDTCNVAGELKIVGLLVMEDWI